MSGFDLDAVIGENAPKPLVYKGKTFELPMELPGGILTPFLNPDLRLVELVGDALANAKDDDSMVDMVLAVLRNEPDLPHGLIDAAADALKALLGDDYEAFQALRPSVTAYALIAKGVFTEYGLALTDFFDSDESSDEGDGEKSKETSPSTTESTPAASSDEKETPEAPSD